jgi:protein-L-isoaspartate(D-aspartate) O-methyltransferase
MIELLRVGGNWARRWRSAPAAATRRRCWRSLAREVYAVERIAPLLDKARANLRQLRLPNVRLKHADGTQGLAEAAPFDTIILAAAAAKVPQPLLGAIGPRRTHDAAPGRDRAIALPD